MSIVNVGDRSSPCSRSASRPLSAPPADSRATGRSGLPPITISPTLAGAIAKRVARDVPVAEIRTAKLGEVLRACCRGRSPNRISRGSTAFRIAAVFGGCLSRTCQLPPGIQRMIGSASDSCRRALAHRLSRSASSPASLAICSAFDGSARPRSSLSAPPACSDPHWRAGTAKHAPVRTRSGCCNWARSVASSFALRTRIVGIVNERLLIARAAQVAGQGVVVARRDGVELVVVAAGAGDGLAQERLAEHVDLVVDPVGLLLADIDRRLLSFAASRRSRWPGSTRSFRRLGGGAAAAPGRRPDARRRTGRRADRR